MGDNEAVLTKLDDVKVKLQRIYSTKQSFVDGKDSKPTPVKNEDKPVQFQVETLEEELSQAR